MLPFRSSQITILVQCFDNAGVIRCPIDDRGYFGLTVSLTHDLAPSKLVKSYLKTLLTKDEFDEENIEIVSIVEPEFSRQGYDPTMLYLVKIDGRHFRASESWPTFISYLKGLSSGPERNAYNKAFQYFAGAHTEEVDVLEVDEVVKKAMKNTRNKSKN